MKITRTESEIRELITRAFLEHRDPPNDLALGIALGTARTLLWLYGDPNAPIDSEHTH